RTRSSGWCPRRGTRDDRGCRLGDRDRPRDARAAAHRVQDVLRLLGGVRRAAQHQRVPGVSRAPRRAPCPERASAEACRAGRARARRHAAPQERLRPEELFLSRSSEGLPDLPVRAAARDRGGVVLRIAGPRAHDRDHRAAPRGGGRREVAARPLPEGNRDRSEPLRGAADRDRQIALLEGGGVVEPQTLLYDSKTNGVRPQRSKEQSHDYRYFPDPDLPPLVLSEEFIAQEQAQLPELPAAKRERFMAQYALSVNDADVLTGDRAVADYYEAVVHAGADAKLGANWVINEVLADAKTHEEQLRVPPGALAQLIGLVRGGTLSQQAAKRVFAEVAED